MRIRWLVGMASVTAAACAQGGGGDGLADFAIDGTNQNQPSQPDASIPLRQPTPDGSIADADSTGDDSSDPSTGTDAATKPGADAGVATTDAGGGADATADATSGPSLDAGSSSLPGASCAMPIDISLGGSFAIDTCALANSVLATCVAGGAGPGAALRGAAPVSGSTYQLTVPTGWVIQETTFACSPMAVSCNPGSWGVSGSGTTGWYFVVARADGTCGSTVVTVNRSM